MKPSTTALLPIPSRRRFLKTSAGLAVLAAPGVTRAAQPNKQIVLGVIGPGGMGLNHLRRFADRKEVELAYVCDPDANHLARAVKEVEKRGGKPVAVKDMRRIFEDKEVDAVVIATPDHWHTPAAILACEAGKHAYVEKPISHNVREGRLLIEAERRHQVIVQHGTQSRSTGHVREAIDRLHAGVIGEVLVAKAWNSQRRRSIGKSQPAKPPAHLDFELWLGPAPETAYRPNMLHSIWRWWHDYGCGDIGNDGVHDLDIARWGLGAVAERHPDRIAALGGTYFFDDDMQWPDTQSVLFEYAPTASDGRPRQLIFEQRIWSPYRQEGLENGNAFYGTKGMMLLGKHGGYKIIGEGNKILDDKPGGAPDLDRHHQNFLDAIRGEAEPNADAATAHYSSSLCHLGNVAVRVGRSLAFNAKTETVPGDAEATALLGRKYGRHWSVPAGA